MHITYAQRRANTHGATVTMALGAQGTIDIIFIDV